MNDVFEQLYSTDELIVAFDAVNVSLAGQKDKKENTAWAHQDQGMPRDYNSPAQLIYSSAWL